MFAPFLFYLLFLRLKRSIGSVSLTVLYMKYLYICLYKKWFIWSIYFNTFKYLLPLRHVSLDMFVSGFLNYFSSHDQPFPLSFSLYRFSLDVVAVVMTYVDILFDIIFLVCILWMSCFLRHVILDMFLSTFLKYFSFSWDIPSVFFFNESHLDQGKDATLKTITFSYF